MLSGWTNRPDALSIPAQTVQGFIILVKGTIFPSSSSAKHNYSEREMRSAEWYSTSSTSTKMTLGNVFLFASTLWSAVFTYFLVGMRTQNSFAKSDFSDLQDYNGAPFWKTQISIFEAFMHMSASVVHALACGLYHYKTTFGSGNNID